MDLTRLELVNLLRAKQLRYQNCATSPKIKLTLLISTRTIDFRLAHTGFEPATSGFPTACSTAEQNALSVLVDTYRSRTDITSLRSQGSTIELMTHNFIVPASGVEPDYLVFQTSPITGFGLAGWWSFRMQAPSISDIVF